ncbi:MAG: hypothetical protein LBR23_05290 [Spirochaetaceae bacterium]|jgi:hypothetical protein|nr:hypothetical protein [Spirochaetaceae bacterium]
MTLQEKHARLVLAYRRMNGRGRGVLEALTRKLASVDKTLGQRPEGARAARGGLRQV